MRKKSKKLITSLFLCLLMSTLSIYTCAWAWDEGGYCGNDPMTPEVVWSFIKYFDYEQYYCSAEHQFTYNNNNRVDAMDLAYYCGHGSPGEIGVWANGACYGSDTSVDLCNAGDSFHKGYGDVDLEFIVFHSCEVIPSPIEVGGNWWQCWVCQPNDIFDGLHQALGFRTNAHKSTSVAIADFFGTRMAGNNLVWQSWFDAINACGDHSIGWDYGTVLIYPPAENDKYKYSHCTDPPEHHCDLRIWWQY